MPPISIMVKPVSGRCNMRCRYCFYADEMSRRAEAETEKMSLSTLEALVRRAFTYADGGVYLAFQGGEPTLAGAEFYRQVLALERKYNTRALPVQHAIQTNGLHLDDELIGVLREGRFLVGLSVDGTREIHDSRRLDALGRGTYDRVMETARRLKAANVDYNVLCVVDRAVARQPAEVYRALAPHGFLQMIPCLDPLDGMRDENSLDAEEFGAFLIEIYRRYAEALRKGKCVSVRAFDNWIRMLAGQVPENCGFSGRCAPNFLVEGNGDVYPCDFYALDEWKIGNVNETTFARMARSEKLRAFCEQSFEPDPACTQCEFGFLCRGGCRRDREPMRPDGRMEKNRLCAGYRKFFSACLPDMRRLKAEMGL